MSQNILVTRSSIGKVRVRAGWDEPMQEIFCNVESLEQEVDLGQGPACMLKTSYGNIESLLASLRGAEIVLPQPMVDAIVRDVQLQARNVVRVFRMDGSSVE